ncbi:hypothetical protein KW787_00660 [Candidatus Pacearchaeota archaeon]|nr:hypothetical protein [Candidatus Pacearchaeota archaeon]
MQIIGFNFTKISAIRPESFNETPKSNPTINIEFTDLNKDKLDLIKDKEIVKISFRFSVSYTEATIKDKSDAELVFEGFIVLSLDKDEAKDILKGWKKKQLPQPLQMNLSNVVLKRCTIKALALEEELNLPTHIRLPQIRLQPKSDQE